MSNFRMCGRTVEVNRYRVDYTEEAMVCAKLAQNQTELTHDEDHTHTLETVARTDYFPTQEEAQHCAEQTGGTITQIDATACEWMDGIVVDDVPDTYGAALTIQTMGKTAYGQKLAQMQAVKNEQLRADIDFMAIMAGVTL